MSRFKFGLQFSSLSEIIQVGRINKAGTVFLEWEDKTQDFYRAVIDMWGGHTQTITDKNTGKKWKITVVEVSP